ncbi:glycosyltransferase family 4 protein [Candidatus Bathyarchaeota archaeon]|nr:glycosyltransferase family 4 protein [Candidatus Bathyarchaeota archaeon]
MKVLVLAPHYHTFIKGSIEAISRYVDGVTVLVHHNHLAEMSKYLPFSYFRYVRKFSKKNLVDFRGKPPNARVDVISTLYFQPDGKNMGLGDKLTELFCKYLMKNNIEFDLIHAHFTWPSGYAGARLSKKFGAPLIITAHGYDVYSLPFKNNAWFERIKFSLDSSDHVITVSRSNCEILVNKLRIQEDKISIIPNGFDSNKFKPIDKISARKTLDLPLNKKIILNVANLVPIKGHRYLIEAMKNIIKVRDDAMLIIVGDGSLKKELENQIKKLGLDGYIKLVGAKPHDKIPLWMNAADLFVLPSLSEGNPTVMFEALGVGLPFIGTAVGGVPEIITSKDYGLLCPPADPECLAEKILIALEKDWDREKIRKYAELFTWENIAKQVVEIYERII